MNIRRKYKNTANGFTLIELLVVIAIIALLLAIAVPSLHRAKEKSRQVVCMAHLHDIGLGLHAYASDNDDKFPDRYTVGGFPFRAAPGYKNPEDRRGLEEQFGIAAVLEDYNCIEGGSPIWVCPGQPHRWMRDLGNTYAYSIAKMLEETRTYEMNRFSKTWLLWDNYIYKPYTPGVRASGSEPGFTIDVNERQFPHSFGKKGSKGANVLYTDSHAGRHCDQ